MWACHLRQVDLSCIREVDEQAQARKTVGSVPP